MMVFMLMLQEVVKDVEDEGEKKGEEEEDVLFEESFKGHSDTKRNGEALYYGYSYPENYTRSGSFNYSCILYYRGRFPDTLLT